MWDVIESADREGSLDSAIRGAELRDLGAFVTRLPALRAIAFNGKTASVHGRRQIGSDTGLSLIDLPSSSGANAMLSRDRKAELWRTLRQWIASSRH